MLLELLADFMPILFEYCIYFPKDTWKKIIGNEQNPILECEEINDEDANSLGFFYPK
eukprot:TRINITY_DN3267_c0_g1_i1.p2 TRINITY_DN3267_c0_g1~~TRINITY_DN3267_c0_g1_i1.p2  ORF type:complete len:57 (+),score=8.09 TRINITY_DN3267_c0_g1_i1:190-360(+)